EAAPFRCALPSHAVLDTTWARTPQVWLGGSLLRASCDRRYGRCPDPGPPGPPAPAPPPEPKKAEGLLTVTPGWIEVRVRTAMDDDSTVNATLRFQALEIRCESEPGGHDRMFVTGANAHYADSSGKSERATRVVWQFVSKDGVVVSTSCTAFEGADITNLRL